VLCIEVEKVYTNNATTANQPERRCSRKVTKEEKQTKKKTRSLGPNHSSIYTKRCILTNSRRGSKPVTAINREYALNCPFQVILP
jgi:hypothetical protein